MENCLEGNTSYKVIFMPKYIGEKGEKEGRKEGEGKGEKKEEEERNRDRMCLD